LGLKKQQDQRKGNETISWFCVQWKLCGMRTLKICITEECNENKTKPLLCMIVSITAAKKQRHWNSSDKRGTENFYRDTERMKEFIRY